MDVQGGLALDAAGNIYGTTVSGGTGQCLSGSWMVGCGMVFELSPTRGGVWVLTVLYNFQHANGDGYYPLGGVIVDAAGNLFGTTVAGGLTKYCIVDPFQAGCGIVFELTPTSSGNWKETVIHSFGDTSKDGQSPYAGLVFDSAGNLYGTTLAGGTYNKGTVFKMTPSADGKWTESVMHSFGAIRDGQSPKAALILDNSGNLYGTTPDGGSHSAGTVFEITP